MVGFTKEAIAASRIARKQNSIARREVKEQDYLKSPKYCENEKCANALSYFQAIDSVRFCSRACSNSVIKRLASDESRRKVSISRSKNKKTEWKCTQCSTLFTSLKKKNVCSRACYIRAKIVASKKGAEARKKNGTNSGWHTRRFEPSYPEKYFMSVFEKEKIGAWEREKKVGRWFIDFAFTDKMIAVEVDGRQHEDPDRKISDENKDLHLQSVGWKVIRIKWKNPKDDNGKKILYPQINSLIEILKA